MAKSRRSHTMKIKRRALSSRVFKPVEDARAERLSAKLLEIAQQPKPERPQAMEVEEDKKENGETWNGIDEEEKDPATEGLFRSPHWSWPIPSSLHQEKEEASRMCEGEEEAFYAALGACSDILGFHSNGDLVLAFDP